jgi:hypothetical protein
MKIIVQKNESINGNQFNIVPIDLLIQILMFLKNDFYSILNFLKLSKYYYDNLLKEDYFMLNLTFYIMNNLELKFLKNNEMLKLIKNLSCIKFCKITDE